MKLSRRGADEDVARAATSDHHGNRDSEKQGMIPWAALLRHAPMILAAADTLLARARSSKTGGKTPDSAERLSKLEQSSSESAQLLHDIAQQVHALTAVQNSTAKRAQVAVVLGIAAVALAAGAWMLILLS
jgi:hypothetical protein